jgi:hypothetical protein
MSGLNETDFFLYGLMVVRVIGSCSSFLEHWDTGCSSALPIRFLDSHSLLYYSTLACAGHPAEGTFLCVACRKVLGLCFYHRSRTGDSRVLDFRTEVVYHFRGSCLWVVAGHCVGVHNNNGCCCYYSPIRPCGTSIHDWDSGLCLPCDLDGDDSSWQCDLFCRSSSRF